jgi:hypothetical protein
LDYLVINELSADGSIDVLLVSDTLTSPGNIAHVRFSDIERLDNVDCILYARPHLTEKVTYMFAGKTYAKVFLLASVLKQLHQHEVSESEMVEVLIRLKNRGVNVLCFATPILEQ